MTEEQKAAYIIGKAAALVTRVAGMQAENMQRQHRGEAMAYNEHAFSTAVLEEGVHHNAIIELFQS